MSWCFSCFKKTYEAPEVLQLDYRHCSLQEVPPDVFTFERTLEYLNLAANQISDLPPSLFHCHELKELDLSDNELASVPAAIGSLTRLTKLDMSRNGINEVSDAIKNCKNLVYLDLSLNHLIKVPEGVSQLVNLENLCLNDTYLEFLHANFGRLTKLRILELRENQLQTLPKSMTRLTHLHRLDLGQNDLTEIPEVVGTLTNLTELGLDNNAMRCIPKFIGNLTKLNCLDVSNNDLREIAEEISKCGQLTDVTLNINSLDSLPDSFPKLESLTVLRLDSNQIQYLPEDFGNLKSLQELSILRNLLKALPPSIGLLRKLHTLYLDDNLLTNLPKELGSCTALTVLHVAKNRLVEIPSELGHLSKLKVLALAGNLLVHLPVSLLNITTLGAVWLSETQSKPLLQFNKEVDAESGQNVLTCYLLPQLPSATTAITDVEENGQEKVSRRSRPSIKFVTDQDPIVMDNNLKKGLMRAPTPYPKELRALAKHASHLRQNKDQNGDVVNTDEPEYEGDFTDEDTIHVSERENMPDSEDGSARGLKARTGGFLDISALDLDISGLDSESPLLSTKQRDTVQSNGIGRADGDKVFGQEDYRYRHPFHANYQQDVMEENRARLLAERRNMVNSSTTTPQTGSQLTPQHVPLDNGLAVEAILARIEEANKRSIDNTTSYRTHGETPEVLSLLDSTKFLDDSFEDTTGAESAKKNPPPYHVAARRAAFFRSSSQERSPSLSSRGSGSFTGSVSNESKLVSPGIPAAAPYASGPASNLKMDTAREKYFNYSPSPVPTESSTNKFTTTSTPINFNKTFTIEKETSEIEDEEVFEKTFDVNESLITSKSNVTREYSTSSLLNTEAIKEKGLSGETMVTSISTSVDSTEIVENESITTSTTSTMSKTSLQETLKSRMPSPPAVPSSYSSGIPKVTRQGSTTEATAKPVAPLPPTSSIVSHSSDDNTATATRSTSGSFIPPSESFSKIPTLGTVSSSKLPTQLTQETTQSRNSYESKLRKPTLIHQTPQPSVMKKDDEKDVLLISQIPSPKKSEIKPAAVNPVLPAPVSISRIPKTPTTYSNSSSVLPSPNVPPTAANKPTMLEELMMTSINVHSDNPRLAFLPINTVKLAQTNNTTSRIPSIGETSGNILTEGRQVQPSLPSSNILLGNSQPNSVIPNAAASTSKIPSVTNPKISSFKRNGSGSRIPTKKPLLKEEDDGTSTNHYGLNSGIVVANVRERKPWIFGVHKNLRVVALDYKRTDELGLGFSVCNGVPGDSTTDRNGVYVDDVEAQEDSVVKIGDKILQVDGIDIANMTLDIVRKVLSNCQENINLLVSRQS